MLSKLFYSAITLSLLTPYALSQKVEVLTDANFNDFIAEGKSSLLEFYAPWCGHCKKLAPVLDSTAVELDKRGVIAKMDCTVNTETCKKYDIKGYPTLKWFSNGKAIDYSKGRSQKDLLNFILDQGKPAVQVVADEKELDAIVAGTSNPVVVLGLFDTVPAEFEKLAQVLRLEDYTFTSTVSADLAKKYGVTAPAVVVIKTFKEPFVVYDGKVTDSDALSKFIVAESFPLVGVIGPDTYKKYVDRELPLVYLFTDPSKVEERDAFINSVRNIAAPFKSTLSFVEIDGVQYVKHGESLGLTTPPPAIVLHDMVKKEKYVKSSDLAEASLKSWFEDWSAKKLSANFKSEPIPASNDGPVKTVVRNNFDALVMDTSKDVLVEFYAPWCGHCKELKPKYEKLGENYVGDSGVTIAMCDATANDITAVEIEGFPTIVFFPANGKESPVVYDGERTTEAMKEFIDSKRTTKAASKDEL